ncbi:MAG: hypothetical protein ACXAEN_20210, partial [Candidatus Thorarchaeota archaeon]
MAMDTARLIHQNIYYHVVSGILHGEQLWEGVKFVTEFPAAEELNKLTLPTISVGRELVFDDAYEISGDSFEIDDFFKITCFCKSDGQRDDLGEYVKNLFASKSKDLLDFNDGFPPTGGQTVLGKLDFRLLSMNPVRIL